MLGHDQFSKYYQLFCIGVHKYRITNLFLLQCARQQKGTDWCGYYICDYTHGLAECGKETSEEARVCPYRSQLRSINYTNVVN